MDPTCRGRIHLRRWVGFKKWYPYYGDNDPTSKEYGASNKHIPLADAEDINYDRYNKYIGAKLIIDKKSNNGGNLETLIRQAIDELAETI